MLVTGMVSAQQSFGLQNHPASRQLRETLDFQLLWDFRFQNVILVLIIGILLTWGVYLVTVYRMFKEKEVSSGPYKSSQISPTSPEYDFVRATESVRAFVDTPAVSFVDHSLAAPGNDQDDRDDGSPMRGSGE